ncbi:MAG: PKD domain-containing protein, partial [candidate division Zixibacteria bacterium]|nr:PKD domain-containing protein [candidate division Zixibacteria bacterium]
GGETEWYTSGFSGTSSASPIVTGAVACLQSIYKTNYGSVLTADEIRTIMTNTGSPQQANTTQHIGPRPDLFEAFNEILGAVFSADISFGNVPLPIQFTGMSAKTVTSWLWDFGDSSSSTEQSPAHTYTSPGVFSVTLAVETTEGDFETIRNEFIVALADTVVAPEVEGGSGSFARADIYVRNTLPLRRIIIPIEWSGPLGLFPDSVVTTGLRTEYFEIHGWINFNPFTNQGVYELVSSISGTSPDLPADTGAVMSVYFSIPGGASGGPNNITILPSYSGRSLQFIARRQGDDVPYAPLFKSGSVSICAKAGDADGSDELDISDATFIVRYIFQDGVAPDPVRSADANCDASVDISDAIALIKFIFAEGPAPCPCAPTP